jgi:hypothetical protein
MDILTRRGPVSVPVLPIVALLLLGIFLISAMRIGRVQGSEIGVFVNLLTGGITIETKPGAHVYNGLLTDFHVLDNTVETLRMAADERGQGDVNIKTEDGSDVSLDVELNFRLVQDPELIRTRVIPECGIGKTTFDFGFTKGRGHVAKLVDHYKAQWVRDYARAVIRYVFGELKTDEFYQASDRDKAARESEKVLNELLKPRGVEVLKVIPDRFRFYDEYEKKIAEKKAADQEVESQKELARAAIESQKRKEVEATAQANVEIATMDGELRRAMVSANADAARHRLEAEAYALTTRAGADATLIQRTNEAKSLLARAEAEAEGLRRLAASLAGDGAANLVKMEYAKALQGALIQGVPYATDPRIQKLEVELPGTGLERAARKEEAR